MTYETIHVPKDVSAGLRRAGTVLSMHGLVLRAQTSRAGMPAGSSLI
jgi:hypothetical protein